MTDKQALKLALEAVHHRMKYYKPNANLYRIYGDRGFMSCSDELAEFEQTRLHGFDKQAWQELIKTAQHLGMIENVSYLETKLKYIESYSWDVEKVKWTMAEMEAIAI